MKPHTEPSVVASGIFRARSVSLVACVAFLLVACGGGDGVSYSVAASHLPAGTSTTSVTPPDSSALVPLVKVSPASLSSCEAGGAKIESGLDTNRNGQLDEAETTSTQHVCNGTPGPSGSTVTPTLTTSLVRSAVEPAGANCVYGGYKISVGSDTNANATLDVAEVTSSDYVCHLASGGNGTGPAGPSGPSGASGPAGAAGPAGVNGLNSLIRTSTEPAGINCAIGGTRIDSGLDDNRNAILETIEIDVTSYLCTPVPAPSVPVNLSVSYSVKSYAFAWSASASATHYELAEDPDGAGVQSETPIGSSIPASSYTYSLAPQLLHLRLNAQYRVRACNSGGCSAYSPAVTPDLKQAIGYFKASNTGSNDFFGHAIGLSDDGNTLAVGATGEASNATGIGGDQGNNSASFSGAVYIFTRSAANTWSQQAYVKASNTEALDLFGQSVALSADGNTLAVGAVGEASNAVGVGGDQTNNSLVRAGAVYVFTRSAGTWSQQAYVKASNPDANDFFGIAVALSDDGNTLAVGAYGEASNATGIGGVQANNSASASGAVYLFTRSTNVWIQEAYVKASNTGANDNFGWAVALSSDGNTLAVSAYAEASNATGIGGLQSDDSAFAAGAVYMFTRNASVWSQQAYVKASNAQADDRFGQSVALSSDGNTLAVGAYWEASSAIGIGGPQADNSASRSGAVYLFTRSALTWSQQAYVKASNTGASDNFGWSVALSANGNTLAVGAYGEASNTTGIGGLQTDNSAASSGAVYVYTRNTSTWNQHSYVKAPNSGANDDFGWAIALSADGATLATAGNLEDSSATGINGNAVDNSAVNSGSVYIY
jgi:hypothetical protein